MGACANNMCFCANMKNGIIKAHAWAEREKILPRLIAVKYLEYMQKPETVKYMSSSWSLTCSCVGGRLYKRGKENTKNPWLLSHPGEINLNPPNSFFWSKSRDGKNYAVKGVIVTFTGIEACGLEKFVSGKLCHGRFFDPAKILTPKFLELAGTASRMGESGYWDASAIFHEIIASLHKSRPRNDDCFELFPPERQGRHSSLFKKVDSYFKANINKPIRRNDIARHLGMSLSAFAHDYQRECGTPPMKRLTELRMKLVQDLLLKDNNLEKIALDTGYCDAFHLSKSFKKIHGISPKEFKTKFLC